MFSDRRGKIIVGGIVTIVLFAIVVLFVTKKFSSTGDQTCAYVNEPPKTNLEKLQRYKNADNTSMATFAGYVSHTQDSSKIYLPIQFDSIYVTKTESGHKLVAKSHCTTLEMGTALNGTNEKVTYFTMIHYTPESKEVDCIIKDVDIAFTTSSHYACTKVKTYVCTDEKTKSPVAELVVENIEFEVDSEPAKTAKDEWSKTANQCV